MELRPQPEARAIPVIDLFAGPGGLGEGFSSLTTESGNPAFDIRLSIEKDPAARRTLVLRSFFRQFRAAGVPDAYYDYISGSISREKLFAMYPAEAQAAEQEAWEATLGELEHEVVRARIAAALGADPGDWVLIGGPPCQAYSLAGRSRMKGLQRKRADDPAYTGKDFDDDHRHFLYREYLRIIADHRPAVFIMENVPGLLSSTVRGSAMIDRILEDLSKPVAALDSKERPADQSPLEYRISGLSEAGARDLFGTDHARFDPRTLVVRAEEYGVPQARHRVLIVGVRSDFAGHPEPLRPAADSVTVEQAIADLPPRRSHLSREPDSPERWVRAIRAVVDQGWFRQIDAAVRDRMAAAIQQMVSRDGMARQQGPSASRQADDFLRWCRDPRLKQVNNHDARSHMRTDLWRYLYAAAYADVKGVSPKIVHFPEALWPAHASAREAAAQRSGMFSDRFRVQLKGRPSTTVVSHISRDGHYYIHFSPEQCRSLTVREAARLQSFPDNYYFEGNRTQQFTQVGNAVPPLLAWQVARSISAFLSPRVSSVLCRRSDSQAA